MLKQIKKYFKKDINISTMTESNMYKKYHRFLMLILKGITEKRTLIELLKLVKIEFNK